MLTDVNDTETLNQDDLTVRSTSFHSKVSSFPVQSVGNDQPPVENIASTSSTFATSSTIIDSVASASTGVATRSKRYTRTANPGMNDSITPRVTRTGQYVLDNLKSVKWMVRILGTVKDRPDLRVFSFPVCYEKIETPDDFTKEEVERKDAIDCRLEKKDAVSRTKEMPFTFGCAYCDYTNDSLYNVKRHVLGVRYKCQASHRYYLRVGCYNRLVEDGLDHYHWKRCPVRLAKPKRFPWSVIVCLDAALIDENDDFPVPEAIANEWNRFYCRF